MKRVLSGVGLLVLLGVGYLTLQLHRRPALSDYAAMTLPEKTGALTVRFAGVTTLLFDDGETKWMTDGFFSRPGKWQSLVTQVAPDEAQIGLGLQKLEVSRLAAVIPVHGHYDHAMDAPVVAKKTGALLAGSSSAVLLGVGQGVPADQLRVLQPEDTLELGRFTLRFFESRHSQTPFNDGQTPEHLTRPLVPPARATQYLAGTVWSILVEHPARRVLVVGSAGFIEGALKGQQADVVFLGTGTLGKKSPEYQAQYWRETVEATGARTVVLFHHDDFTRTLDQPLELMPYGADDFSKTLEALKPLAADAGVALHLPPLFVPFSP